MVRGRQRWARRLGSVADVPDAIAVGVELVWICVRGTVVAHITDSVQVDVVLVEVGICGAFVAVVGMEVGVSIEGVVAAEGRWCTARRYRRSDRVPR
jgi:hypothetical protein